MPRTIAPPIAFEIPEDNGIETLLFINRKPQDKYYFLQYGGWDTEMTDEHLDLLPPGVENLIVCRKNGTNKRPLKLSCTPKRLGQQALKSLAFICIVEGLETDELFSECTTLEQLWISGHERTLFGTVENLKKLPLKHIGLGGRDEIKYPSPELGEFIRSRRPGLSVGCFR